jgi:hypothetical protein
MREMSSARGCTAAADRSYMRQIALAVGTILLLGCSGNSASGLSDERFINVVVELRQAAETYRDDPDGYVARKDEILNEAGVDETVIREYVEVHGGDLQHMARIWTAINERMTEPAEIQ